MPESFVAKARDDGSIPLCTNCEHAKHHHKPYGLCTGLGTEAGENGRFCHCARFHDPHQGRYSSAQGQRSTYRPGDHRATQSGFQQSSSRQELGDGKLRPRPNLQGEHTVGGADPDWMMFGVDNKDGTVTVYASTKLSFLRLYQDAGHFDDIHRELIETGKISATPWDVKGRMVDYVKVQAPTYNEAIRLLFTSGWRPDGEPTTADLQTQLALEEARRAETEANEEIRAELTGGYAITDEDEIVDAEIVEDGDD